MLWIEPQRQGIVEEVGEQFVDAAEGTVADEGEAEDQLPQPGFGHGQPEEELRRSVRWWREGLVEGVVGVAELLIDELAADLVLVGQGGDGLAGESVQGELLSCLEGQQTGRGVEGTALGRWTVEWTCLDLRMIKEVEIPSIYGGRAFHCAYLTYLLP